MGEWNKEKEGLLRVWEHVLCLRVCCGHRDLLLPMWLRSARGLGKKAMPHWFLIQRGSSSHMKIWLPDILHRICKDECHLSHIIKKPSRCSMLRRDMGKEMHLSCVKRSSQQQKRLGSGRTEPLETSAMSLHYVRGRLPFSHSIWLSAWWPRVNTTGQVFKKS